MLHVFNTLDLGKTYSADDVTELSDLREYGLDNSFYGGRCYKIGKTDTDVLLILENKDGLQAIDTAAVNLENIHFRFIKKLADKRKIKYDNKTTKEELIALLS